MKRKSKHEKKSGLNEDIGLTSELIDEIKEKMLTEHGALGIQFALALEAMKGSTIPLKIEQKEFKKLS